MSIRICRQCGASFSSGGEEQSLCPDCLAAQKASTLRPRTCRQCGRTFPGGPRAWYCPACRAERKRDRERAHRRSGAQRKLGSTDLCESCGKPYIVSGGLQRYCPQCAPEMIRRKDNASSRAYNAAHPDRKQELRAAARLSCVFWHSASGRWRVYVRGKYLGSYASEEDAIAARDAGMLAP